MKVLDGGCRVYSPDDGMVNTDGSRTTRAVINRDSGAKLITQSVHDYGPGTSPPVVNPGAEEVLYVAGGNGMCIIDNTRYPLRPGAAVYIPPNAAYRIENVEADHLRIVSSCCPVLESETGPPAMIHEDDREEIRAGEDRIFRYLVHTDLGCRQVTQFVGWIPRSKAPFHTHTYEEAIYILEGQGILHLKGHLSASEFGPGDSIYLPAGVVHCLENPGPAPIRLLGVFYPSGSPGAAYEND